MQINDSPVVLANALRIDFIKEEFDRTSGADAPLVSLAFQVANQFLARLRVLARATHVRPLDPEGAMWFRLEYLNDDETELVPDPELNVHRSVMATSFAMRILGLRRSLWDAIEELPTTYEPPAWETLILDAGGALPEVGPPLVLAFAALETRIEDALDFLARAYGVSPALWSWLNHRDDPRRMPSVEERLDALCRAIGSKSLKDEQELWEGFKHLRRGRNTFVHHGRAEIGGVAVDSQQARQLVQQADQILNWIEDLLPKAHRRPRHEFPMDIQVIQPVSQVSEDQAGPGEET